MTLVCDELIRLCCNGDRVYCAGALLDILEEPARVKPALKNGFRSLPLPDLQGSGSAKHGRVFSRSFDSVLPNNREKRRSITASVTGSGNLKFVPLCRQSDLGRCEKANHESRSTEIAGESRSAEDSCVVRM